MKKLFLVLLTLTAPLIIALPIHAEISENEIAVGSPSATSTLSAKLVPTTLKIKIRGPVSEKTSTYLIVTSQQIAYTINTNAQTRLLRRFGGRSTLSEVSQGDEIMAIGQFVDDSKTILTANLIRNLSIMTRHGLFVGLIDSLTPTGFVLKTNLEGTQTVTISEATQITNANDNTITQQQLRVGQKIKLWGLWDKKQNAITQVSKIRDLSLQSENNPTSSPSAKTY